MGDETNPPYEWTSGGSDPPPNPYIMTIDELQSTQEALKNKETLDRSTIFRLVEPDVEELKKRLIQWASLGFPDAFMLFSVAITPPLQCIDGAVRPIFQYIEYLLSSTLHDKLQALQTKLPGMVLSYSLPVNQVCIHVSKA